MTVERSFKSQDPARQAASSDYQEGYIRGLIDTQIVNGCPPGMARGPDRQRPLNRGKWMYRTGYENGFQPLPCCGPGMCKKEREKREKEAEND